jgi:hypothetical protein
MMEKKDNGSAPFSEERKKMWWKSMKVRRFR